MTDITELTSVQKNANIHRLSRLIAYAPNDELRQMAVEVEHYTDQLIEALEKAQQRNAELESFRTAYMEWSDKTAWVQTDKRFDVLKPWGKHRADVLKEYIQHLESRTVKLPKPISVLHRREFTEAHCAIYAYPEAEVNAALDDAGIKVEADSLDADVSNRNQPGMVVAVHIDVGDFVKFRGQVYEVKETDFDDHDVTLWFVCGEVLKCAAGCPIEVVSAPVEDE
ncbi:hypothetical protein ACORB7_000581 [Klebsiella pneumoniae]|uniref:hypothetical protein n=1 Tax=Klebsiella pneumoniae complex TaxID=3390273 RepID=UPI001D18FD33|nr:MULTISPECIES: hypothetical protein [Klebsiella]